jgi:nucleoside-diphosphate-sugar epimerase
LILYNGATGGVGRYLAAALASAGKPSHAIASRLEDSAGLVNELACLDPGGDVALVHLAAMVSVPACEADPSAAYRTNVELAVQSTKTIIEWARSRSNKMRVVFVSTGHVYAEASAGVRLSESAPTGPRSIYAQTKLQAEVSVSEVCREATVPLVVARVFGLLAPSQPSNYVLPSLIRRARARELTDIPGLSFTRDYLDARDVCDDLIALADVARHGRDPAVVNVCSGVPTRIIDLLTMVLRAVEPTLADDLLLRSSEAPGRRDDIPWLVGDPSQFALRTGHAPQRISVEATVREAVGDPSLGREQE